MINPKLHTTIFWIIVFLLLSGCARLIPNARMIVEFKVPLTDQEMISKMKQMAALGEYTFYTGIGFETDKKRELIGKPDTLSPHTWYSDEYHRPGKTNHKVKFRWRYYDDEHKQFELIYYASDAVPFSLEQWQEIGKWHNYIIPSTLPGATIRFNPKRHPAYFTEPHNLLAYSTKSGVPMPGPDTPPSTYAD